jgi:hypothetical protein
MSYLAITTTTSWMHQQAGGHGAPACHQGCRRVRELADAQTIKLRRLVSADEGHAPGQGLWDVVAYDAAKLSEDRMALEVILRAVPSEMTAGLAAKDSVKGAWDAIASLCVSPDRVKKANTETLRREFSALAFKDGESVEEFVNQATALAAQLMLLGDVHTEQFMRKIL